MAIRLIEEGQQVEDVLVSPFVITKDNYSEYQNELEPYK